MPQRTVEFILGVLGGMLGIVVVPALFFVGGFAEGIGVQWLVGWAVGGGILSIVGFIGAVFVKSKPRPAGVLMFISGILGLFVALGAWIGALLLIVAGIIALLRKEKQS